MYWCPTEDTPRNLGTYCYSQPQNWYINWHVLCLNKPLLLFIKHRFHVYWLVKSLWSYQTEHRCHLRTTTTGNTIEDQSIATIMLSVRLELSWWSVPLSVCGGELQSVKILAPQQWRRLMVCFFDLHLQGGSNLTQWRSQPKILEAKMFDFRRAAVFFWDAASQTTKWLNMLKFWGTWPPGPHPSYIYGLTATSTSRLLFKTMHENRLSDQLFACASIINKWKTVINR